MPSVHVQHLLFALCAVAATAGPPAHAGNFVYTSIDAPGANATYATSINDKGEVVGVYTTSPNSPQYAFVWSNGTISTFAPHIAARSVGVAGIDNHGEVAFTASSARSGVELAKIRGPGGKFMTLPTPAGAVAWAGGINAAGQIVGGYQSAAGSANRTGFLFQNGQLQDIVFPGAALTTPSAIANNGTVIGTYSAGDADPAHGFTYQNGTYQSFDPPGSTYTIVNSINPHGDIAGTFYTANRSTGTLGYVLSGGKFHTYGLQRGKEYVNEVTWSASANQLAGNFYNLVNQIAFTYVKKQYYQMLPFGAANSYIYAGNRQGTLVGLYIGTDHVVHSFVAVCPTGQAPCTN